MDPTQKEMYMQFLVIYNDLQLRLKLIRELIPTEEEWAEREKLRKVPTMSGRMKVNRSLVEEELAEVEGILDNVDVLMERIDQATKMIDTMVAAA